MEIFSKRGERNCGNFTQCIRNKGVRYREYLTSRVVNCELVSGKRGTLFPGGITFWGIGSYVRCSSHAACQAGKTAHQSRRVHGTGIIPDSGDLAIANPQCIERCEGPANTACGPNSGEIGAFGDGFTERGRVGSGLAAVEDEGMGLANRAQKAGGAERDANERRAETGLAPFHRRQRFSFLRFRQLALLRLGQRRQAGSKDGCRRLV
jgi:hypothetical protein